jgi:iron(III) transport system permease protein
VILLSAHPLRVFKPAGGWAALSFFAALLILLPLGALAVVAAGPSAGLWPHLAAYVLPQAAADTAALLLGVGLVTIIVGTGTAWLVTAYEFPGRAWLDWALLLPLAMPTYIIAYAYLDVLHPVGPLQTFIRDLASITNPQDLRLPDPRSMGGCILLMGFALYPYVYLTTRSLFLMQSASLIEAAQTLGAGRAGIFFRVALPLARPAVAIGVSLALMEALNDIGASEFLGVRTMTVAVYTTWITRSDLAGAAQIALFMLAIVVALVAAERWFRRRLAYAASAQKPRRLRPQALSPAKKALAFILALLPVLIGFGVPAVHVAVAAWRRMSFAGLSANLLEAAINTFLLSTVAALLTIALGIALAYFVRLSSSTGARAVFRTASLGYAIPGTVLAIGLLTPLGAADRALNAVTDSLFGVTIGLVFLGSGAALIYAYVARFLAISAGGIEAGFSRISMSLDHAARTLGESPSGVLTRVHLPLLRPAIGAAAMLVFVDCMKELSATLLLRPLSFETLATLLYGEAARGTYEDGSLAALAIVLLGIAPVIVLAKMSRALEPEKAMSG